MSWFVYLIRSEKGFLYVGSSNNTDRRLNEHNSGHVKYTKKDKGWYLIYKEEFSSAIEARTYELKIKRSRFQRDNFYKKAGI